MKVWNRKTVAGLALGILMAGAMIISLILFPGLKEVTPSGKITAFFPLYSFPEKEEMETLLRQFQDKYPGIELESHLQPYLNMKRNFSTLLSSEVTEPDRVIVAALLTADQPEGALVSPGSWTGLEWSLYYNEKTLVDQGFSLEEIASLPSEGLSEFISRATPHLKPGQSLFSVSSRYYIQYLAWLQHLELERNKGRMPASFEPEKWEKAIESFRELEDQGLINEDHGEINEAATALNMFRGKALFTLYTDNIYGIFLPGDRIGIKKLRFPGSDRDGWFVGTGFYLTSILPQESTREARAAAAALVEFLRSDLVIRHMMEKTETTLNPARGKKETKEIPSLSERVRNDEIRSLLNFLIIKD